VAKCPFAKWMPLPWTAGSYVAGPFRIVHHTTEGSTAEGAFATYQERHDIPHFTVDDQTIYQHIDTETAATALAHPAGTVETNRLSAIQFELVGFAGKPKNPASLRNVGRLCRWIEKTHNVPTVWPNGYPDPPVDGGDPGHHNRNQANWKSKGGHYGHCHVPVNVHWDPAYTADEVELIMSIPSSDDMEIVAEKVQLSPMAASDLLASNSLWSELIAYYRGYQGTTDSLKTATLAQWAVESGRGTSPLAQQHLNFGGIKFRQRMVGFATPVDYTGTDGQADVYCKFASLDAFVKGYWHFIQSGPYADWNQYADNAAGYIRYIAPNYAGDPNYVTQVLKLFDEAHDDLFGPAPAQSQLSDDVAPVAAAAAAGQSSASVSQTRVAVVVGHNKVAPGSSALSPISQSEFPFNSQVAAMMKADCANFNLTVEVFVRQANHDVRKEITAVYAQVAAWKPDCAIELHFNSADNPTATGSQVLFRSDKPDPRGLAANIVHEVTTLLGLPARGGNGLDPISAGDRGGISVYALPDIPSVLSEPFFGSNKNDCLKVAAVGEDGLALAYLRGIRGWAISRALTS
jgi:Mannosyl-glycoprotein endo-beta-N-acetylglucosaminidase/N-acetylmuramoyl-L-alanine amidase